MDPVDVSVVIPTFRREKQLREAVGSVLVQHAVAFEIIVVDDSAEGSARGAVASIDDARVRYVLRKEPSGGRPACVRNDGAMLARGRYLHFLDDDDMLESGALSALSKALDAAPAAGMAFGVIRPFGRDEVLLKHHQQYFDRARLTARRLKGARQLAASLVFRPSVLNNSACMARRSVFAAVGGFDAGIPVCEDADLWARIAQASAHVFIDRPVVRYRTGEASILHDLAKNDEKMSISYRRIQDKYRQTNGQLQFLLMKFWARAILR
jgi:GT2 family glycosyltransferase